MTEAEAAEPPKKKHRITKEQAAACFEFFDSHKQAGKFNRNTKLPVAGSMPLFDAFLQEQHVSRSQAKTQFSNWKKKTFEYWGEVYNSDPKQIREQILSQMPTSNAEFIKDVLIKNMVSKKPGCATMMRRRYPSTVHFFKFIISEDKTDNPFLAMLLAILNDYVDFLVEVMPTQAKLCEKADTLFKSKRDDMLKRRARSFVDLIKEFDFSENHHLSDLKREFDDAMWMVLFYDMENKLHHYWTRSTFTSGLPPIEIAKESVVIEFARGMVYFTAGVIVKKIGNKANKKYKSRKEISDFVFQTHKICLPVAKQAGLPTDVCEARRLTPIYASKAFFEFILIVESTFVMNATTEMMMAYCDGSLFNKIKDSLVEDKGVFEKFKSNLCLDSHKDKDIKKLLSFTMTTYRNIRARWFVNKIRGQQRKSDRYGSTRDKVLVKAEVAAAKSEARSELKSELALKEFYTDACEETEATKDSDFDEIPDDDEETED